MSLRLWRKISHVFCNFILVAEPVESNKLEASGEKVESELLEFSKFDINRVLKHGERLVGSSGAEYDLPDEDLIGRVFSYCKWL